MIPGLWTWRRSTGSNLVQLHSCLRSCLRSKDHSRLATKEEGEDIDADALCSMQLQSSTLSHTGGLFDSSVCDNTGSHAIFSSTSTVRVIVDMELEDDSLRLRLADLPPDLLLKISAASTSSLNPLLDYKLLVLRSPHTRDPIALERHLRTYRFLFALASRLHDDLSYKAAFALRQTRLHGLGTSTGAAIPVATAALWQANLPAQTGWACMRSTLFSAFNLRGFSPASNGGNSSPGKHQDRLPGGVEAAS